MHSADFYRIVERKPIGPGDPILSHLSNTVCLPCDAADAACVYCAKQQTQLEFAALCSGLRYAKLQPRTCRINANFRNVAVLRETQQLVSVTGLENMICVTDSTQMKHTLTKRIGQRKLHQSWDRDQ